MLRFKKQKVSRAVKGFRLPTIEYEEDMLDIADKIVVDADNTYYMQMDSDAMIAHGIYKGSLLAVDKTLNAAHGCIVVAFLNGEWFVRQYNCQNEQVSLKGSQPHHTINISKGDTLTIWGVVTVTVSCMLPKTMLKGKYRDVCAC
ncbi:LexA family protein [Mucilaginibacter ginkgonis]|uniref:Peptidase S24/S26A/S26B/S26C domain-containing protein n=1 Tax=Mucilaginibacter ginkgonis TaxID=2682091 RepID=A0A6I4I7D6_9SPHI|nr:S24 family peptidase [Mucilaginibacter ginkgonis]QQL49209.1 hypothetical protein GO620_013630 [Mucilaginibacter ginkgonis]